MEKSRPHYLLIVYLSLFVAFICLMVISPVSGMTRWSSMHIIPDADFIAGGNFDVDAQGYFFSDSVKGPIIGPTVLVHAGITEWVNLELGYAGGLTFGFKARILGEMNNMVPSLAIGARNIIASKESNYFNVDDTAGTYSNEFFLAMGKKVDLIKTRFHVGILTMPSAETEKFNFFIGMEKYFGAGIYGNLELYTRQKDIRPCLFVNWRVLKKKNLEIGIGVVDIKGLLLSDEGSFSFSLTSSSQTAYVKPGIWFGIRYLGELGFGKSVGFSGIEDRLASQYLSQEIMQRRMDSLSTLVITSYEKMSRMYGALSWLADSLKSDKERLRVLFLDKLFKLKGQYAAEPFDPEAVRSISREITGYRERALPVLQEFVADNSQDKTIRLLAIFLIGEVKNDAATATLLDVLSQTQDPELRIETLIALGKIGETRAAYLMEQLANDPNDAVAFTAQEVLRKLQKDKGIKLSNSLRMREIALPETTITTTDKKIMGDRLPEIAVPATEAVPAIAKQDSIKKDTTRVVPAKPEKSRVEKKPVSPASPDGVVPPKKSASPDSVVPSKKPASPDSVVPPKKPASPDSVVPPKRPASPDSVVPPQKLSSPEAVAPPVSPVVGSPVSVEQSKPVPDSTSTQIKAPEPSSKKEPSAAPAKKGKTKSKEQSAPPKIETW